MTKFNDFIRKYNLKNKTTSNKRIFQVLQSLSFNDVGFYLGDGPFPSDVGIEIIYPSRGTHWVVYIIDKYFDSYGCSPPEKISKFNIKRNGQFCILNTQYMV